MTVKIDWNNAADLHDAYWSYRKIITNIPWVKRAPNMPAELTEAIVCLCTGAELIEHGHGDIRLPQGEIGEVKGTSGYEDDLSSFSPSSEFEKLFFVHMDRQSNDIYHVYDLGLSRASIANIKVNNTETFADHSQGNRRPRFSIINQIITPQKLSPNWKVDMAQRTII